MRSTRHPTLASLTAVTASAALLFAGPKDLCAAPAKPQAQGVSIEQLQKQIEAIQASLDALKAQLAQRSGAAEPGERQSADRGPAGAWGRGHHRTMRRRMMGSGPMRPGEEQGRIRPGPTREGKLSAEEPRLGMHPFERMLERLDEDKDGVISKDEIAAARQRFRGPQREEPSRGRGGKRGRGRLRGRGPSFGAGQHGAFGRGWHGRCPMGTAGAWRGRGYGYGSPAGPGRGIAHGRGHGIMHGRGSDPRAMVRPSFGPRGW